MEQTSGTAEANLELASGMPRGRNEDLPPAIYHLPYHPLSTAFHPLPSGYCQFQCLPFTAHRPTQPTAHRLPPGAAHRPPPAVLRSPSSTVYRHLSLMTNEQPARDPSPPFSTAQSHSAPISGFVFWTLRATHPAAALI